MIAPLMTAGFTHMTMNVASSTLTMTVSSVASQFFTHVFLHPGEHFMAVCIICVITVGLLVGSAYGVKKLYDKYHPQAPVEE